ncbi:MAG: YfhO family protein [Ruminococcus sp.]|nr:YfhO family protein [Ruminococcus sp.]
MSRFPNIRSRSGEKYHAAFLLGFVCLLFSLIPVMAVEKGYFIYGGDYNAQQINFYHTANTAVRSGQIGWHWFTDLGTDFMASYSFYLFGSPFFWLSTLLPAGAVTYALPVLLAVKHGLASMTAYAYIRRFVRTKDAALAGGLLYAFSGFQVYNIFFNHFQDVTAFFPLMLIAMEESVNRGRRGVFALTVAFMAILNYYFFAGQAVFLVLYYLFRRRSPDFDTDLGKFARLAIEAVIGTMIAAVVLLPSALAILGNDRLSERLYGQDMLIYDDSTIIPRVIQGFFMPPDPPANPNLFESDYAKWASIGGYLPLFSMTGVIAFMKGRRSHWASKLSVCLIIFAFIPFLNSSFQAFNGYYYARWFYMPVLVFSMMSAQSLDDHNSDLMGAWKLNVIILGVFALIGTLPTKSSSGKLRIFHMPKDPGYFWITVIVAGACLAAMLAVIRRRRDGRPFMELTVMLTLFASVGCIYTTVFYDAVTVSDAKTYISCVIEGADDIVYEPVSQDNFFRADISEDDDNYPMYWGLPCMRTFHSVVSTSIMDFYSELGIDRSVASRADITHYALRGLFSVKYYYRDVSKDQRSYSELVSSPSVMPEKDSKGRDDYSNADITSFLPGFEYIATNGSFEVYENKLFIPMGFAYDSFVTEGNASQLKDSERERLLMRSLVLSDKQAEKYSDILTDSSDGTIPDKKAYEALCREKQGQASTSFTYDAKGFEAEIQLEKPALVFFSVPYSEGWTAEVNGEKADVERVSYGFMAVRADAGSNTIIFRYRTPGLAAGAKISLAGILLLAAYIAAGRLFPKKVCKAPHKYCYDYSSFSGQN